MSELNSKKSERKRKMNEDKEMMEISE